jgi:hypothetical protein
VTVRIFFGAVAAGMPDAAGAVVVPIGATVAGEDGVI